MVLLAWPQLMSKVSPTDESIYAEVRTEISSSRSQVGDPVELVVLEDWHQKNGVVMVPAKALLKGKITAVQKHKGDIPGMLGVVVNSAEWNGNRVALRAVIASVVTTEMGRHQTTELVLRGANQGTAATGSPEDLVYMFPKDCSVEKQNSGTSAMVCQKRNVALRKTGRVLLLNEPEEGR